MSEFFRNYYDKHAEAFNAFAQDSASWTSFEQPALDRLIPSAPVDHNKILDIGCGGGRVLDYLMSRGFEDVTGIDISSRSLEIARSKQLPGNLVHGDALSLPFRSSSFDIVMSNMTGHTVSSFSTLLNSVYPVLKPRGSFVFIDRALGKQATLVGRHTRHTEEWQEDTTRWGPKTPAFNYDMWRTLWDRAFLAGFTSTATWSDKTDDTPGRIAVHFQKMTPTQKQTATDLFENAPPFPLLELYLSRTLQ